MIYSMTAYARLATQDDWSNAVWEIRSVNHRYLDLNFRLPDSLRELEASLRERARQMLQRGKVECHLRFQPSEKLQGELILNSAIVQQLSQADAFIRRSFNEVAPMSITDVLSWPGALVEKEINLVDVSKAVLKSFDQALQELMAARAREGAALQEVILARLAETSDVVNNVKKRLPNIIASQREKMLQRLEAVSAQLDQTRFEQEMVYFVQKIDVAEELDRLTTHVVEVKRVLAEDSAVGRKIDFLLQELNREANTLASKSVDTLTTKAAVELKVLIEQVREQAQNIE